MTSDSDATASRVGCTIAIVGLFVAAVGGLFIWGAVGGGWGWIMLVVGLFSVFYGGSLWTQNSD